MNTNLFSGVVVTLVILMILQSRELCFSIQGRNYLHTMAKKVGGQYIPPLVVDDSAFPLTTWLMKPLTNAVLTEKQILTIVPAEPEW